jgi:Holliday junction resolvasome RuvABC ATP-dependent DNA helicase subunit
MSETYETSRFDGIIGQNKAKRKLDFYVDSWQRSNLLPNMMFTASKGCGKTLMAKALAKELQKSDWEKPKKYLEVNCASIKNAKSFFDELIIPSVHDRDVTILFDEASELPQDVEMALLSITNPNPNHRNSFAYDEFTFDFNFRRQTFMFATSEPHKVFHALMDRLDRIDLEDYTHDELGKIVALNIKDIEFDDGLLGDIASVLRGNARGAQKMAEKIEMYLATKDGDVKRFDRKDWKKLCKTLGIIPLGLYPKELRVLRVLRDHRDVSLTRLGTKTGLTVQSLRQDYELFLQSHDLMEITTAGRNITKEGREYLKEYEKDSSEEV